eukprot:CAMPEP_0168595064 /NCGR_PEP_ID=MMETSP0420-20121227/9245_1 /TAXON_ID=498008 /ORGANISM="Pessonella sp." /LENGTH=229 /DNA_ID=CAMNT_0008631451 /DNA_START=1 /DNA_END=690 /DNA_ORIENTATION=+
MYVVLMNDLLLLAKQRAGEPVSYRYEHHMDMADVFVYHAIDNQGRPVEMVNRSIFQLVNKRRQQLTIYSFRCPSMHARKRWVTALTQRINHYMEASAHAVEQRLSDESLVTHAEQTSDNVKSKATQSTIDTKSNAKVDNRPVALIEAQYAHLKKDLKNKSIRQRRESSVEDLTTYFIQTSKTKYQCGHHQLDSIENTISQSQKVLKEIAIQTDSLDAQLLAMEQQLGVA